MNLQRRFASSFVAPALLAISALAASGAEPEKKQLSLTEQIVSQVSSVVRLSRGAICRVAATDNDAPLAATGFFVDDAGTFITTYAVVAGEADDILVTVGDEQRPAKRLSADPRAGIAVLRVEIDAHVPFLKLAKPTQLPIASPVIALGYPIDLGLSPSFGIVAEHNIGFHGRYFATRHIRANLAIQRGQMGSPLLNLDGEVVGLILSAVEERSGVFALPVAAISKVLDDTQQFHSVRQGWFGTDVKIAEPRFGSSARISEVRAKSPGEKAGLRVGDVLLQMGAWKISTPEDVLNATYYLTAAKPVQIRIGRDDREEELTIVPAEPPNGELPSAESTPPSVSTVSAASETTPKTK